MFVFYHLILSDFVYILICDKVVQTFFDLWILSPFLTSKYKVSSCSNKKKSSIFWRQFWYTFGVTDKCGFTRSRLYVLNFKRTKNWSWSPKLPQSSVFERTKKTCWAKFSFEILFFFLLIFFPFADTTPSFICLWKIVLIKTRDKLFFTERTRPLLVSRASVKM